MYIRIFTNWYIAIVYIRSIIMSENWACCHKLYFSLFISVNFVYFSTGRTNLVVIDYHLKFLIYLVKFM